MNSVENRHILLLSPGFAAHDADHQCIPPLQAYLPALHARFPHWTLSVIALQYPYRRGVYHWQGQEVYSAGGRNRRLLKPLTWQRALRRFRQLHRRQPVDLIHSFWLREATWLGQRIAAKQGIPQIATIMGQDALPDNRYLHRLNFSRLTVTAISRRAADQFAESTGQNPPVVIPWGLSAADMQWQVSTGPRDIDLLGVGSLVPVKDWPRFVRVVARLAEQRPGLKAVIVGDGPERPRLEAMIRAMRLDREVELRGNLERAEVLELMARSRVLLHTARSEGQGYVFPEALSRGMHLVSTPVGMAEEGEKWAIRRDTVGLDAAVRHFLDRPVDTLPRHPLSIHQTVEEYARLYATLH